jgi:hypothetical protein
MKPSVPRDTRARECPILRHSDDFVRCLPIVFDGSSFSASGSSI